MAPRRASKRQSVWIPRGRERRRRRVVRYIWRPDPAAARVVPSSRQADGRTARGDGRADRWDGRMTAPAILDDMSGADLADAIEREAGRRGVRVSDFVVPLTSQGWGWLNQLRN